MRQDTWVARGADRGTERGAAVGGGFTRRAQQEPAGDNVVMDGPRPTTHLRRTGLGWFDFDPSPFVERARAHAADYPGLDTRFAACRRAAWLCDCYLALAQLPDGHVANMAILWEGGEDLAVDLDREGNPVGIEFLERLPCRSE